MRTSVYILENTVYVYMWNISYCYRLLEASLQNIHWEREIQIVEKLSNVLRHILFAKYSQICRVFVIAVGLEL